ncbi:Fc.00g073010.m01.CDS01 [Cosmosporella sp. VM-42]
MFFQEEWWNTQILQLAHFESCIRHALVALATYHEQYTRRIADTGALFAARQQNLAIQKLLLPTQQPLTYVHLVTCSIFICIEVLQGNHEAAIRLFKHGRGMLEELQQQRAHRASAHETTSDVDASIRFMETLFTRLAIQVSMLVGDVHPELSMELLGQIKFSRPLSNRPINSLLEARQTLTDLIVYSIQAISGSDERRQCVKGFLKLWLVTFEQFCRRQHGYTLDDSERRGSALLNLHANCLLLTLDLAGREGVEGVLLRWDNYTERYQRLLGAAALAMERGNGEQNPVFHLELGAVPVLFIIISQCRHPIVRRQAIDLLRRSQVQEGVWSSELTGKVAQRIVDLEEAGITVQQPSDITAERRISSVVVHLQEGQRRATVIYTGQGKERKELVEW